MYLDILDQDMCLYQLQIVNLMYYLDGIINRNLDIMIINFNGQGMSLENMFKILAKNMDILIKYLGLDRPLKISLM
jgi:hypothetical protein